MLLAAISTGSAIAIGLIFGVTLGLVYWSRYHGPVSGGPGSSSHDEPGPEVSPGAGPGASLVNFAADLLPEHYEATTPSITPAHDFHETRTPEIKPETRGPAPGLGDSDGSDHDSFDCFGDDD